MTEGSHHDLIVAPQALRRVGQSLLSGGGQYESTLVWGWENHGELGEEILGYYDMLIPLFSLREVHDVHPPYLEWSHNCYGAERWFACSSYSSGNSTFRAVLGITNGIAIHAIPPPV